MVSGASQPSLTSSMVGEMLDFLVRPLRSALGVAEHDAVTPFESTEREIAGAADAARRVSDAIEHHIEVVEGLATAVGPLTESVNRLNETMTNLVVLLAPMASAEHEVAEAEHEITALRRIFGPHRHTKPSESPPEQPES
jgi:hypothetical protein